MSVLRRVVLLRHGETQGDSGSRFHGSNDVALSDEGRRQVREAAHGLRREVFELVVASPLRRSWRSAAIVAGTAPVRLEAGFREVHFGRWEGLSAEEIQAQDPVLYEDWQDGREGFEYPSGERRADFRARVLAAFASIEASGAANVLCVLHKGVIRVIAEHLGGALEADQPALGSSVSFSRAAGGAWRAGRRSSNPEALVA